MLLHFRLLIIIIYTHIIFAIIYKTFIHNIKFHKKLMIMNINSDNFNWCLDHFCIQAICGKKCNLTNFEKLIVNSLSCENSNWSLLCLKRLFVWILLVYQKRMMYKVQISNIFQRHDGSWWWSCCCDLQSYYMRYNESWNFYVFRIKT